MMGKLFFSYAIIAGDSCETAWNFQWSSTFVCVMDSAGNKHTQKTPECYTCFVLHFPAASWHSSGHRPGLIRRQLSTSAMGLALQRSSGVALHSRALWQKSSLPVLRRLTATLVTNQNSECHFRYKPCLENSSQQTELTKHSRLRE